MFLLLFLELDLFCSQLQIFWNDEGLPVYWEGSLLFLDDIYSVVIRSKEKPQHYVFMICRLLDLVQEWWL